MNNLVDFLIFIAFDSSSRMDTQGQTVNSYFYLEVMKKLYGEKKDQSWKIVLGCCNFCNKLNYTY